MAPGGRLCRQRDLAYELLTQIPGVSVVKPKAALYMFPRLDPKIYPIADDQQFAYELLAEEKVLIVQGTGFNWIAPDHFRLVFLPNADDLTEAIGRIERFLSTLPQTPHRLRPHMNPIQVGLLGIGTVGSGTFQVLQRNQEEIRRRAGRGIEITMVADLDTERARAIVGDAAQVVADARAGHRQPGDRHRDRTDRRLRHRARRWCWKPSPPASTWSPPTRRCWPCMAARSSPPRAPRA